jgi:hypothetical protein
MHNAGIMGLLDAQADTRNLLRRHPSLAGVIAVGVTIAVWWANPFGP